MNKTVVLILIIFFLSCSISKHKEIEPNNNKWQAQPVNIPIIIKGDIENKNDIDYYKIICNVAETNLVDIILTTDEANPLRLDLYNTKQLIKGEYLKDNDYKQGQQEIIFKNILITSGVYYLRVNLYNKKCDDAGYTLRIKLNNDTMDIEKEPNDILVEANIIDMENGFIKGYFNPGLNIASAADHYKEADWYYFEATDSSNILSVEISSVPNIDPIIELYNHLGFLIKKIDSLSIDEPEILKNFGIPEQGKYFIKVYNKNLGTQNYEVPYQLYLTLKGQDDTFEFEYNDSMKYANKIKNSINGYINPANDVDFYRISLTDDNNVLNISLTPLNNVDLKLDIYNEQAEKIYSLNSYPKNQAEILPNLFLKKGNYYLSISDTLNKNQNYLDFYTLNIKSVSYQEDWEIEPNDLFTQAMTIELNQTCKGYIAPNDDKDTFVLHVDEQKSIKIDVSPIPQINYVISIYSSDKKLIQEINNKTRGQGESELITLAKGTYYVILKDAEKKSNTYENYILSIYER